MGHEDLTDDIEERAEQLLNAVLELNQAQVDSIYIGVRPTEDSKQRAFELAKRASERCQTEKRPYPPQLRAALANLQQMEFPLPATMTSGTPRILLIDQDAIRLQERAKLFGERQIDVEIVTTATEGLSRLEGKQFHLVIVDCYPTAAKEEQALVTIQTFNLHLPVINVQAWVNVMKADNRRLNRDLLRTVARLLRKPVPRRLPAKRSPSAEATGEPVVQQPFDVA